MKFDLHLVFLSSHVSYLHKDALTLLPVTQGPVVRSPFSVNGG